MAGFLTVPAQAGIINFDDAKAGEPPPGWTAAKTGSGSAMWAIEKDGTAPSEPNVLFTDPGMVGVWTKADSVTLFDDFSYGSK